MRSTTRASTGATSSSSPAPTPCVAAIPATCRVRRSRRRSDSPACQVASSYAACASGTTALSIARAQILAGVCDVALVVGADTTPKGFLAPQRGRSPRRSGLAAVPPVRRHQPGVLRVARPPPHGSLRCDQGRLRDGEGQELAPRGAQPQRALQQRVRPRRHRQLTGRVRSAASARDLRHVRRRRGDRRVEHGVRARHTVTPIRCASPASR